MGHGMNFSGGRTTLITNLCAFFVACIVTIQTMFIMSKVVGSYGPSDTWMMFVPVLILFVIR